MSGFSLRLCGFASKLFVLFFFFSFTANAQEVSVSIDTANIKIGEQIRYHISVKTDSSKVVVFPEGQTFSPLEMVEAYKIDTSSLEDQVLLQREYALTKFDSGAYVIPPQRVRINDREISTDSFLVQVGGVMVDTTKQKMYPIKPALEVPEPFHIPTWVWWVLGGVILLALIIYLLFQLLKKKKEAKRNLPPFEKAMLSLKELDEGKLLEDREIKTYYSVLTDAARRYLDEKVDDRALESTTTELIDRLQLQKDSGKLNIDQAIIDDFDRILKRADLAKFARSRPDVITAKEDRGSIEKIIKDTKEGIPEPTEEELQKDAEYRKKWAKKQKRKRIITWVVSGIVFLAIVITVLIATKGISYVRDQLFGNDTKELLQDDWVTSEYGNPQVRITTPRVLIRTEMKIPEKYKSKITAIETFSNGSLAGDFYTVLSTLATKGKGTNSDKISEWIYNYLEAKGAKNIVTKKLEFSTSVGVEGTKITGSFSVQPKGADEIYNKEYVLLNFTKNGGVQQILMVHNEGDEYAEEIVSRIVYSVELKIPNN